MISVVKLGNAAVVSELNLAHRGVFRDYDSGSTDIFTASFGEYSPYMIRSPKQVLKELWHDEDKLEQVERDYEESLFYLNTSLKSDKIVHIIAELQSEESFVELAAFLQVLYDLKVEQVTLHLIITLEQADIWQEFASAYPELVEKFASKIVLGSLMSRDYIKTDDHSLQALSGRVLVDPQLTSENEYFTTIDEYLKVTYNSRYYQNYEVYSETFLEKVEALKSISEQITAIIKENANDDRFEGIFPCDIRTHSLGLNDEVLVLNRYSRAPEVVAWYVQSIAETFNLHTQFLFTQCNIANTQTYKKSFLYSPERDGVVTAFEGLLVVSDHKESFAKEYIGTKHLNFEQFTEEFTTEFARWKMWHVGEVSTRIREQLEKVNDRIIVISDQGEVYMSDGVFQKLSSEEFRKKTQDIDPALGLLLAHDYSSGDMIFTYTDLLSWVRYL
jgi:hypothetical protein